MTLEPGIAPTGEPQSFEDYLLRVNPTGAAFENLAAQRDETPIIMLNLLRFRPRRDPRIYAMYGKDAAPEVDKTKSYIGFFGMTITDMDPGLGLSADWDGVVLPVYRRRGAFLQLQRSPIYQRAIPLRTAGTFSRLLYVLKDPDNAMQDNATIKQLNESREPIISDGAGCLLLHLDRVRASVADSDELAENHAKSMAPFGGKLRMTTVAEVPVVSEQKWTTCRIAEFPSQEALADYLNSPQGRALRQLRGELCEQSLSVAAKPVALPG